MDIDGVGLVSRATSSFALPASGARSPTLALQRYPGPMSNSPLRAVIHHSGHGPASATTPVRAWVLCLSAATPSRSPPSLWPGRWPRSEEHTSELQSLRHLVCRLLLE